MSSSEVVLLRDIPLKLFWLFSSVDGSQDHVYVFESEGHSEKIVQLSKSNEKVAGRRLALLYVDYYHENPYRSYCSLEVFRRSIDFEMLDPDNDTKFPPVPLLDITYCSKPPPKKRTKKHLWQPGKGFWLQEKIDIRYGNFNISKLEDRLIHGYLLDIQREAIRESEKVLVSGHWQYVSMKKDNPQEME